MVVCIFVTILFSFRRYICRVWLLLYTHQEFERQKNLKALGLTILICAIIFLLMFLISWTLPQPEQPIADEGIEVNLGNSDQGMGDIAPEIPGEMCNSDETNIQSPKTAAAHEDAGRIERSC